jgi:hypothetical protein
LEVLTIIELDLHIGNASTDLDNHKRAAHSETMAAYAIQCTFCEKKYNSRQNYYLHVNKGHRELLEQSWCGFIHYSLLVFDNTA